MEGELGLVHGNFPRGGQRTRPSQDEARGETLEMPLRFEPGLSAECTLTDPGKGWEG